MIYDFFDIIEALAEKKDCVLIAIDGRCASGKTTLAEELSRRFDCNVLHMDDFFLRPCQRTSDRLAKPGENVDHERFLSEVLIPLVQGKGFTYRPFNCKTLDFDPPVSIYPKRINIIEGSYSCHPRLWDHYDYRICLWIGEKEQLERIEKRSGKMAVKAFTEKWIPLEEAYFKSFDIPTRSDLLLTL